MQKRRRGHLIFSFILILFFVTPANSLDNEIRYQIGEGNFNAAYNLLLDRLSLSPDDPDVLYYLGVTALSGNTSSIYLKEYLTRNPDGEHGDGAKGRLMDYYSAAGMLITASRLYQLPLEGRSENDENIYKIALNKQKMGDYDIASGLYKKVIREGAGRYKIWAELGLADCMFLQENYNDALSQYKMIIENYSESSVFPLALVGMSETFRKTGDLEKAGVFYELYRDKYERSPANPEIEAAIFEGKTSDNTNNLNSLLDVDYYIQVGVFARKSNANTCLRKFRNLRYTTRVVSFKDNGKVFYKVIVGPYKSESEARRIKADLEQSQGEAYLIFVE